MSLTLLLLSVILTLWILRRQGALAPASVFGVIATASLATFYGFEVLQLHPDTLDSFWQVQADSERPVTRVAIFYAGLVVLALCAHLATMRVQPIDSYSTFNPDRYLFRMLRSPLTSSGLVSLLLLSVAHLMTVDVSAILYYRQYLSIRDPAFVGINNPIIGLVHTNIPLIGCIAAPLSVVYLHDRRYLLFATAGITFVYSLTVSLAFASRFAVVQLVAAAMMFQILSSRKLDRRALGLSVVAVVAYLGVIGLRRAATSGVGDYGLIPLLNALPRGELLFAGIPAFIALTSFGGGFVMARVFAMRDLYYPLEYKILSFSPVPSLIDGFASIRHFEHRINVSAPFSSFAEAYHFGPVYFLCLILLLLVSLVLLNHFWRRFRGALAFFILAPAYYAFIRMHLYPIRNVLRWLLVSLIVATFVELLVVSCRQREKEGSRG